MTDVKTSPEPPSYSDSVLSEHSSEPSDYLARLAQNRTSHLCTTIDDLIAPVVNGRLNRALSSTTIALIPTPADVPWVPSTNHDFKTPPSEIVGLASDHEFDAQIQLTDDVDRIQFWRQTGVIAELEQMIKQRWNLSLPENGSQKTLERPAGTSGTPISAPPSRPTGEQRSASFFSRLSSRQGKPDGTNTEPLRRLNSPQRTPVKVRYDEICFRTVSSFGLYETVVKPAVIISIDMAC